MSGSSNSYKQIGEIADQLKVNPKTIRYYEQIGLIPEPHRSEVGYRLYTAEDRERLAFILRAKGLDFSLEEIGEILNLREQDKAPCPYVLESIEQKIALVEEKIADLVRLKGELEALQEQAGSLPSEESGPHTRFCHLIEGRDIA